MIILNVSSKLIFSITWNIEHTESFNTQKKKKKLKHCHYCQECIIEILCYAYYIPKSLISVLIEIIEAARIISSLQIICITEKQNRPQR